MSGFDQKRFNDFAVDNKVVGFFAKPITLKSGRKTHWYVNWRRATSDVFLLDKLTDFIIDYIAEQNLKPDCIFGVPEGATKTALITMYKWVHQLPEYGPGSHVFSMGRAKPKEHGDPQDRFFVGAPQGSTLVLEDVTTTAGSLLQTIDQLIDCGVKVTAALSLSNRSALLDDGRTTEELFDKVYHGEISYYSMSQGTELLNLTLEKEKPDPSILKEIEKEL